MNRTNIYFQKLNRKNELRKIVTDAIEEKKTAEMEAKREMEFCDKAVEIFERSKRRIEKIKKLKAEEELQAKMRHAEYLGSFISSQVKIESAVKN